MPLERSVMDSEMRIHPEYVGHTAKDALTDPRRKQEMPIDAELVAQRPLLELFSIQWEIA
jgi:hypothetical protein